MSPPYICAFQYTGIFTAFVSAVSVVYTVCVGSGCDISIVYISHCLTLPYVVYDWYVSRRDMLVSRGCLFPSLSLIVCLPSATPLSGLSLFSLSLFSLFSLSLFSLSISLNSCTYTLPPSTARASTPLAV
eukprot:GHVS01025194.1.p1 GENE.GHVS01025194.1~~GHVS01025194.1.p1  ORF type:complete len:130 (+),score=14.53 GHVS01025194.1:122-511(+)